MSSSGMKCYHLDLILSSGAKCYHLELNVIIWDEMLSSGANVIIWDKMLSCGSNVVMLSFGANVISWCYHVMLSSGMLSSGMITSPILFFLKTSLTQFSLCTFCCKFRNTISVIFIMLKWKTLPSETENQLTNTVPSSICMYIVYQLMEACGTRHTDWGWCSGCM